MPTEAKQATVAELTKDLSDGKADDRGRLPRPDGRRHHGRPPQPARAGHHATGWSRTAWRRSPPSEAGRDELTELLDGPTGLAMGGADEVALARAFLDAIRPFRTRRRSRRRDRQSQLRRRRGHPAGHAAAARGAAGPAGRRHCLAAGEHGVAAVGAAAQPGLRPQPARRQESDRAGRPEPDID